MGFMQRLATAPISWGVCEVPGWGLQLPMDRVLGEMVEVGFTATELGSPGFFPEEPEQLRGVLDRYGLSMLAAFVPVVIHDPDQIDQTLKHVEENAALLQAVGGRYFNSAPVMTWDWGPRHEVSSAGWDLALSMFGRIEEITSAHGLEQVLHPHFGILVETREDVQRVLDGCEVSFVLDTAHLAVGGYDPVDFVRRAPERVGLVHIKDADMAVAAELNAGRISLMEAVQQGIFPAVGRGDLGIAAVIETLERGGYRGWYVLEQDAAITDGEPPLGSGPVEGVRESLRYLEELDERLASKAG